MDRCVCCGAQVPEGRQVCPNCEKTAVETAERNIYGNNHCSSGHGGLIRGRNRNHKRAEQPHGGEQR